MTWNAPSEDGERLARGAAVRFARLCGLLGCLTAPGSALAKDAVVYQGENASVAVSRVVVATSGHYDDFDPIDLDTVFDQVGPALLGPGRFEPCTETVSPPTDPSAAMLRTKDSVDFLDYEAAEESYNEAIQALACLDQPVDPVLIGQLHFLMGVAHLETADQPAAWEAFEQALVIDPQLNWNEDYPDQGRPTFTAVAAKVEATQPQALYLVPPAPEQGLWIDGVEVPPDTQTVSLKPGRHWIQLQGASLVTATLDIEPGSDSVLLLSPTLPPDFLSWSDSDNQERQAAVQTSLTTIREGYDAVFASTPDGMWRMVTGARTWTRLGEQAAPTVGTAQPLPEPQPVPHGRRALYWSLVGGGAAATLYGVVRTYGTYRSASQVYTELVDPNDPSQYNSALTHAEIDQYRGDYDTYRKRLPVGYIIGGVGVALAAGGTVGLLHTRVQPTVGSSGLDGLQIVFPTR